VSGTVTVSLKQRKKGGRKRPPPLTGGSRLSVSNQNGTLARLLLDWQAGPVRWAAACWWFPLFFLFLILYSFFCFAVLNSHLNFESILLTFDYVITYKFVLGYYLDYCLLLINFACTFAYRRF
jgi:hypothetical protein